MAKILIIEDEGMLSDMYKQKFLKEGFRVTVAAEAKEALSIVKKKKFDLILLDLMLPRKSGIYFLEKLRELPNGSFLPVFAFTNLDTPDMRKKCQELKVMDYLIKAQYTPKQVVDKVKKILKKKQK